MPYGMGPWGWFADPYAYQYWGWGRCRRFPWLPRRWWTGMYGSIAPYWAPLMPKEEMAMLQDEAKAMEQELETIRKRLEELKK